MSNETTYWIPKNDAPLEQVADEVWSGISLKLGQYYIVPEILGAEEPVIADPSLVRYEAQNIAFAIFEDVGTGIVARFGTERESHLKHVNEAMRSAGYEKPFFPTPSMESETRELGDMTGYPHPIASVLGYE